MERLKYRVWDNERNKYHNTNDFIDNNGVLGCVAWTVGFVRYKDGLCVVEQCTGLKDKNGKLIYEGDIVKKEFKNKPFSSKAKTKEKLIKIKWNDIEACFSFDFLNEKDKHDDFQCWENSWGHKYSDDEVIGNIHENADLLEEEQKADAEFYEDFCKFEEEQKDD